MKSNRVIKAVTFLALSSAVIILLFAFAFSRSCVISQNLLYPNSNVEPTKELTTSTYHTSVPLNIEVDEAKFFVKKIETGDVSTKNLIKEEEEPFVVCIDLSNGVRQINAVTIPENSSCRVRFRIQKPGDNESVPDKEFNDGIGGSQRYSFIIKGRINGKYFVYKSKKPLDVVVNLNSPVNVQDLRMNLTKVLTERIRCLINGKSSRGNERDRKNSTDDMLKNNYSQTFKDDDHNRESDGHRMVYN